LIVAILMRHRTFYTDRRIRGAAEEDRDDVDVASDHRARDGVDVNVPESPGDDLK
jgi:hypothetical protein